jgi:hypothetical protein
MSLPTPRTTPRAEYVRVQNTSACTSPARPVSVSGTPTSSARRCRPGRYPAHAAPLAVRRVQQRAHRHGLHVEGQCRGAVVKRPPSRRRQRSGYSWRLPPRMRRGASAPYHQRVCICHHVWLTHRSAAQHGSPRAAGKRHGGDLIGLGVAPAASPKAAQCGVDADPVMARRLHHAAKPPARRQHGPHDRIFSAITRLNSCIIASARSPVPFNWQ